MLKIFSFLTALVIFSTSTFAQETLDPKQLLEKMVSAQNTLNYEISFVKTTPTNMESLRYRHINQEGKNYSQLITLDGVQQEIVQRENLVSYFQPNTQAFSLKSGHIVDNLPALMRTNVDKLSENYDIVPFGRNRVADRIVQTLRILPKDDFRYQYLIFIDEQNHLLLRSDMLDREGNLLDQFRVVNLYIGDELSGLSNYINSLVLPPLLTEPENQQKQNWKPDWLPQGFKLISQSIEQDDNNHIESQFYSDGLFSFTVYVSNSIIADEGENSWKQGATTFYSETRGDKELTFIGQLPIFSAKRIIQDIQIK
ncbi:sigma-E factor regulatory protein RseB [Canicola haemoglobinophilus]|uniref:Periplasmic negative regulator of sigmaE n=1 Tax=Canicola haemoglobinophilus TaxID=733 RepID=A0A1V4AZI9_9PAST|nr:sigma-E factor regulatory protein RseB [Canicola haemoglobinophilus]OOR98571.1 sigma-E factor regulatory protein RseB [Canicola haemoglobinophilus]STO59618.1 periplasmic negative regulator of sigmaE [Canicola haemoglobinophilus]